MNKLIRAISVMLIAFTMVSCAAAVDAPIETTASTTAVETETEAPDYLKALPDRDYGGSDVTILTRIGMEYEVWAESENGEIINDAVVARNRKVDEKYNVSLGIVTIKGGWEDLANFKKSVSASVLADDSSYDIISGYLAYTMGMGADGYFVNLYSLDDIDLTNPWWVEGFVENNTLLDHLYFALGDFSLSMWENIYAIFFNKQMTADYGLDAPYQTVKDGSWTLDRLIETTANVSSDLNGDGSYDDTDLYGFVTNNHSMRAITTSFNIRMTERNTDGIYDLCFYNEKTVEAFNRLYDYIHKNNSSYILPSTIDHAGMSYLSPMFMADRAMFMTFTLTLTDSLRDMKSDFGIIPFPKYDDTQADYMSHSFDGLTVFGIPISASDYEMSAMMLEALSAESKQSVIPMFYDVKLKVKVTRDNDSAEMLDIIRENMYFDFAYCHTYDCSYVFSLYGDMIGSGEENFVSKYTANEKSYLNALEKLQDKYIDLIDQGF